MPDVFSVDKRKQIMRKIHTKNTTPELKLRSLLHRNGFRYSLNRKDLPGKPDIVLPKYKKVIFVHGCFWHGHNCNRGHRPTTNEEFWNKKLDLNILRDKKVIEELEEMGWKSMVVWECEIKKKNEDELLYRLKAFLFNE